MVSQAIIFAIIAITLSILFLALKLKEQQKWKFPPGPPGVPFFGNLFTLLNAPVPHLQFSEWAKTYGGIFTITSFTKKTLVISCPKLMRQILDHSASAGREILEPILVFAGGYYGITATQGKIWSEQRKFCVRTLRQFGMGKSNEIQTSVLSEAELAVKWVSEGARKNNGIVDNPIELIKTLMNNTLWRIVRGERLPDDDEEVKKLTGDLSHALNNSFKGGLAMLPWLKWIIPERTGYKDLMECSQKLRRFVREEIEEHEKRRGTENGEEPRDMIDAYIDQLRKCEKGGDVSSTFYGEEGLQNSVAVMCEMFEGGGESTPHTLNWLILHLSHNQDVQRKLQAEIDKVLGTQEPSLMDKARMPYTEAVILETLRRSSAFPLNFAHRLTEDVNDLCGFKLPKGVYLLSNIYYAHMDKQLWGDPEAFRPERFLSEGDTANEIIPERKACVVAFNVGKRVCPGAPLAMDILFLFVVKLFQAFNMSPFPENSRPDLDSSDPFITMAKSFSIVVKERPK